MGLAEEFAAEKKATRPGVRCSVSRAFEALSAKDRAELEEAMAMDPLDMPHTVIARVLSRKVSIKVPAAQISKCRSEGGCCGDR